MTIRGSFALFVGCLCVALGADTPHFEVRHHPVSQKHAGVHSHPGCSDGYYYRAESYRPSAFEEEWKQHLKNGDEDACSFIHANIDRVDKWLMTLQTWNNMEYSMGSPFVEAVPRRLENASFSEDVFSKFIYVNVCPGEYANARKEIHVEPLVGHLRHPHALQACFEKMKSVDVMSTDYIHVNPWSAADFHEVYHGKRYLFDLGTSTFDTSLQFLTTRFRQAGVEFDSIWAWETANVNARDYWESVPDIYRSRIHFYNTPVGSTFMEASHPLNIIRSLCQPENFIAIKLDIDNDQLETSIVEEIEGDPQLRDCISEMMFEQHYTHQDLAPFFGEEYGATLTDVTSRFAKLREAGLLIHYWP